MEIIKRNVNGSMIIDSKAVEEMAQIACLKVKDIFPYKKEDSFAECKCKNDEIIVEIHIKIRKGVNVDEVCKEVQRLVYEHIYEMTSIKVQHVDVVIQGFELGK